MKKVILVLGLVDLFLTGLGLVSQTVLNPDPQLTGSVLVWTAGWLISGITVAVAQMDPQEKENTTISLWR